MPDAKLTCIDFWVKAGSFYEETGEEGIAHFLEHMVFKGSKNLKEGEFDRKIEALGGSSNAATGFDDVHYYVLIPSNSLNTALELLIELVLFPKLDKNSFKIEKEVVLEEIAQYKDQPDEQIFQKILKSCWRNHPYGRPILGLKKSLKEISVNNMKNFYKRNYQASNCTISIAGKLPKNIKQIINKSRLSELKNNGKINIKKSKSKKISFHQNRLETKIHRLESCRFIMAWPSPPAENTKLVMGADIATTLLSEGRGSRLVHRLREDLQIVESIDMDVTTLEKGGLILLEAICIENNLEKVEEEIHKILKEIIKYPIQNQEVKRAHQLVKNSICFSLEVSNNVASSIGSQALWGRHQPLLNQLKYIEYWTGENLQRKLFSQLQPEQSSTLIAKPQI